MDEDFLKEMEELTKPKKAPPQKRYRLYCAGLREFDGNGYDKFLHKHYKSQSNVIEHLVQYGAMMTWYQIVDTKDDMKVIKEKFPDIDPDLADADF